MAKSKFKKDFQPTQHKGRRIPLHLTEKVERELKKLIDEKQIKKFKKCSDEHFISPVVITVKSDQSIKIALDSKILNDAIHKNKYQMQSIDHLMDKIGMKISELKSKEGTLYFSKIDLKYAYSQLPLHPDTQKHCNFNILGGNATGTYKFLNGFYGLTDLPATFQKMMDSTLDGLNSTNAFLDKRKSCYNLNQESKTWTTRHNHIMNHRNQTKPLPRKGNANSETKKGEPIGKTIAK